MRVHVALYGGARVVSGQSAVNLSFDLATITLAQMLEKLIVSYPRVRPYLLDASGKLQTSIRVLINKERPEPDATLETLLHDEDQVTLLVAVAGGDLHRIATPWRMEAQCSFQAAINHM